MKGIVLYEINLDGCLNGVYSTDRLDGEIFNEIAKKRPVDPRDSDAMYDDLTGTYDCRYLEEGRQNMGDTLRISIDRRSARSTEYKFEWYRHSTMTLNGFGFRMNSRQIAVRYTDGSSSEFA